MIWVSPDEYMPPDKVVSIRYGGSVMFGAYDRIFNRWVWVIPGAGEQVINKPQAWLADEDWLKKHRLTSCVANRNKLNYPNK